MLSTRRNNWLDRLKGTPAKRRRKTRHDYDGNGTENLEERVVLSAVGPTATGVAMPVDPDPEPTNIIFVDDDARPGGDGGSWETAFNNLNDALRLAASTDAEDDIYVMVGTYSPADDDGTLPVVDVTTPGATGVAMPIDIDPDGTARARTFKLPDDVDIYGGFEDASQLRPEQRTGRASETILTGDLAGDDHLGGLDDNARHVVTVNGTGDIRLDRFTVTAGRADGSDVADRNTGGGILVKDADGLKLHNVIVTRNLANYQGGGVAVYDSTNVKVSDSSISHNKALNGGGVYVEDSQFGMGDTKLAGNQSAGGGAIDASGSRLVLRGVKVGGNTATNTAVDALGGNGGALRLINSTAHLHGGTFANNGARIFGGAIYALASNLHVDGTAFISNTAGSGGGAIAMDGTTFTGTNMTVADNSGGLAAGGIGGVHSDMTVSNSVFRANTADADFGGALVAVGVGGDYESTLKTRGNTFNGNKAAGDGGAVYVLNTNWKSSGDEFIANVAGQNGGAVRIDEINFEEEPVDPIEARPVLVDDGTLLGTAIAKPLPVPQPESRYVTSIDGAHFEHNVAHGRDNANILSGLGGAIFALTDLIDDSHLGVSISDSDFVSNVARNGGAVVLGNVNRARINGSGFKDNRARAIPVTDERPGLVLNGDGGAILVGIADVSVTDSEFSGNHAGGSGGAVYSIAANMRLGNSRLHDNTARDSGGAIFVDQQSSVGVNHSGLSNNSAGRRGGAIAVQGSKLAVNGTSFTGNSAEGAGGAIAARRARVHVNESKFGENNSGRAGGAVAATADSNVDLVFASMASNVSQGNGGAVAATDGANVNVTGGTYSRNGSRGNGGAISVSNGASATVSGATLTGNGAVNGGAIAADGARVTVDRSTMNQNLADGNGGAIAASDSQVGVTASLVVNNHTSGNGGAVALRGSQFYTKASVYGANTARGDGGAIYASDSLAAIDGAFFIRNAAAGNGGAIAAKDSTLGVINSIFDGNSATSGNAIHAQGSAVFLNGNYFGPGQDIVLLP